MRGDLIYKILDLVKDQALDLIDLEKAMLISGYGASMGKIDRNFNKFKNARREKTEERKQEKEKKLRLQKYISKLKLEGLLYKKGNEITITKDGKKRLSNLEKNSLKQIPRTPSNNLIIFSYDIPGEHRKLRDRLREILKMMNFEMIHQSLWVGKIKISEELLEYLSEIRVLGYVEILEVTKQGTLKQLT